MKITNKKIKISVFFLLLLMCGLSIGVLYSSTMVLQEKEDFNNPKSSAGEITIITPENKTYTEPDSGYYPATYGFENDLVGSNPEGWIIWDEDDVIEVIDELDDHKKVLRLYDSSSSSENHVQKEFLAQDRGQLEFWMRTTDVNDHVAFDIKASGDTRLFVFGINGGNFYREEGSGITAISSALSNTWYHIKIIFRASYVSTYESLSSSYTWKVFINGVENGIYTFVNNQDIEWFRASTANMGASNVNFYIDAVAFSWDQSYAIGDNLNEGLLLSYDNNTTLDWQGYSLDRQANKTIMGNTTIPLPSDGAHRIQVFGNDTLGTMYESQVNRFSVHHINILTPEATIYTEPMSGYFPATYGFESDAHGSNPSGWIISETGATIDVINSLGGHNKIIEINKDGSSNWPYIKNLFTMGQVSGTVEFWMRSTDVTQNFFFYIMTAPAGVGARVNVGMLDDYFIWNDGSTVHNLIPIVDNTWYHIRVDFECGSGAYEGLSADNFYVHINGQRFGQFPFRNPGDIMEHVEVWVWEPSVTCYLDAISYSWDTDYNIGDNLNESLLLSFENTTTLDWKGYSFDGQVNRTILGNTTIPMPSEGAHQIQVFGNDSTGVTYESAVRHFTLDTLPPQILIALPSELEEYSGPPPYYLAITEANVESMWYTLNDGAAYPIASYIGGIDLIPWSALHNSAVSIKFYIRDIAGREVFAEVIVVKVSAQVPTPTPQPFVPGFNIISLLGITVVITLVLAKKKLKK